MYNNASNAIIWIVIIIIILIIIFFLFAGFGGTTTNQVRNFNISLSGDQEVPPVVTNATGNGTATLSADRQQLTYDISAQNFSSEVTAAHFHRGARGQNGPVVKDLNIESLGNNMYRFRGTWNSNDSSQPLTSSLVNDLLNGNLYVNIHTEVYPVPEGEIRGQVVPLLNN